MFDGPDYGPFCIAPFVAFYVGLLVYGIGMSINTFLEKKFDKKPDWWKEIVLLFSIILVPVACITSIGLGVGEANPAPWFDPTVNNIAGKWILIPHTILELAKLEDMPDPASELVFYDDGTFIASEIPDMWSFTDYSQPNYIDYISGSGKWYLTKMQGTRGFVEWILVTEFSRIENQDDNRTMRYYFKGHLPPYTLTTIDSRYLTFRFHK